MKVQVNKEEAEMINRALKYFARRNKQRSEEAEDIATSIMYEEFEREYQELSNKFPY